MCEVKAVNESVLVVYILSNRQWYYGTRSISVTLSSSTHQLKLVAQVARIRSLRLPTASQTPRCWYD